MIALGQETLDSLVGKVINYSLFNLLTTHIFVCLFFRFFFLKFLRNVISFISLVSILFVHLARLISGLWKSSLQNNHLIAQRYLLEDDRVIFMFEDGEHAWDAKDYLLQQPELIDISIEGKQYYGPTFNGDQQRRERVWLKVKIFFASSKTKIFEAASQIILYNVFFLNKSYILPITKN